MHNCFDGSYNIQGLYGYEYRDIHSFLSIVQLYEKEGMLHLFFLVNCHVAKYFDKRFPERYQYVENYQSYEALSKHGNLLDPIAADPTAQCCDYTNVVEYVIKDGDIRSNRSILSCGGTLICAEKKNPLSPSFKFDNFKSNFQCDEQTQSFILMTSMQYPLKNGYKFVITNPDFQERPKSDTFILDSHNNRFFTFLSPLSDTPNHAYFPSAILPSGDMLVIGGRFLEDVDTSKLELMKHSYAIYWETSSLAYFKPLETTSISAPASTLLSASALLVMTQADLSNIGLCILLAVNVMLIVFVAKRAIKHAYQCAAGFFSEKHQKNTPLRQNKDNDEECQLLPFDHSQKQESYHSFSETTSSTYAQKKAPFHQKRQPSALITFSMHNKNKFAHSLSVLANDRAQNKKFCAVM